MGREGLARTCDGLADLFKLAPDLFDLRQGGVGGRSLGFQGLQRLFRLLDLPLQCIVLFLGDFTLLQLLIGLLRRCLQGGEFLLGLLDGISQEALFLCDQLGIGGIKLQQFFYIFQLRLRAFDFFIDTLQRSGQFCGIAANLNSNTLNSASHRSSLPSACVQAVIRQHPAAKREPMDVQPSAPEYVLGSSV